MGIAEKDGEGNPESSMILGRVELGESGTLTTMMLDVIPALQRRVENLEDALAKIKDRPRNAADTTEQVMMWFGIAYIVSLLLPPLLQLIRGSEE